MENRDSLFVLSTAKFELVALDKPTTGRKMGGMAILFEVDKCRA